MTSYKTYDDGNLAYETGRFVKIDGAECLKQRLTHTLRLDYDSWYFAPDKGFPWFEVYQKKEVSARMVKAYLGKIISADAEVTGLQSIVVELDRKTRTLRCNTQISSKYGIIEVSV